MATNHNLETTNEMLSNRTRDLEALIRTLQEQCTNYAQQIQKLKGTERKLRRGMVDLALELNAQKDQILAKDALIKKLRRHVPPEAPAAPPQVMEEEKDEDPE